MNISVTKQLLPILTIFLLLSLSQAFATKMLKTTPKKDVTNNPFDWKKPEPGHFIDGAKQMIISGTDLKLYLSGGSAQVDIREGEGKCFIPSGVRFKEKSGTNSYSSTITSPENRDGGTWYDRDLRRLVFLGGKTSATEDTPLKLTGDSWLIARCYNAVVHYEVEELDEPVKYVSPLRDPEAEAKEEESLKRLRSRDPFVRSQERFKRNGGLRSATYYKGGVFNGF